MNIGQWEATLAAVNPDLPVLFSGGGQPDRIGSWRGIYAEASLFHGDGSDPVRTAGWLLDDVREVLAGKVLTGYKGGDYSYDRDTRLWADDYGDCFYRGIAGVKVDVVGGDARLVVTTADFSEYA